MYIYVVTMQMKAPPEENKKKTPFFWKGEDAKTAALRQGNTLLVNGYDFPPENEFILATSGVAIFRVDFYKFRSSSVSGRFYTETIVIDDFGKMEETVDWLKDRAREALKKFPVMDVDKPFTRMTNDNTLPGLEEYELVQELQCEAEKEPEENTEPGEDEGGGLMEKLRSLFTK